MKTDKNSIPNDSDHSLPGVDTLDQSTQESIRSKLNTLANDYKPRTRHVNRDGTATFTNRLILESSPYLLQHAHNPVNWYSWGDEAFQAAGELNRPLLVSIGYSTCHWCHVMEEESFEDLEVARYLNQHYICIKVDREERPDVDAVYMTAVQAMTGSGGWPLNVMVTKDRKPFWGGTYFPTRDGDRGAAMGFLTIIQRISHAFLHSPDEIGRSCLQLTSAIERFLSPPAGKELPGSDLLDDAIEMYRKAYDPENGGLMGSPKFPSSLPLRFLLRHYQRTKQPDLLEMATFSLKKMAAGGIYDQVGGGFHRYATDAIWRVPHFEKMLYDNALLTTAYIEAFQVTGDRQFRDIAVEILEYVLKEMTAVSGAFYSATDADSLNEAGEREEGYFFTWTPQELAAVLGEEQYQSVQAIWNTSEHGNFEGRNIFYLNQDLREIAGKLKQSPEKLAVTLKEIKELLYEERAKRPHPLRDDKIIVSWNGLMISAFAKVGAILGEERYLTAAKNAAGFIKQEMMREGRLYRIFKNDGARHKAFLSDYANYIAACLDLFQATQNSEWLKQALELDHSLEQLFEDKAHGGCFMSGSDQEVIITREKPVTDGALPSGNSITMKNLLRLHRLTLDQRYFSRFNQALSCFLGKETSGLAGYAEMLTSLEESLAHSLEIVIITPGEANEARPLLEKLNKMFLPQAQINVISQNDRNNELLKMIPYLADRTTVDGKPTCYICQQGTCQLPVTDPESLMSQLEKLV